MDAGDDRHTTVGSAAEVTGARPADLARDLASQGVRYMFGAYVDLHGVPKSKCVPIGHLESAAAGSERYTVGALEGMGALGPNEDECLGVPDLDELVVLPWDRRYAVAPADLVFHGEPYTHDSRHLLKRQVDACRELGYGLKMGIEPEVYVVRETEDGCVPWIREDLHNAPTRGYDLETTMLADGFLEPMVEYLDELGWDVQSFDHEGGDGQYEFDFDYTDAVRMADRMLLFRLAAKHVARSLGCVATFMPKPFPDGFGSGAHINLSLADERTGANAFGPEQGNGSRWAGYSELAYRFTAGVLRHSGAITALACPTVNSYKRLVPIGQMREITWAPVYRAYGENNRTLMCRLPENRHCVELRIADSACNFYLTTAMTVAAGLEGIRLGLDPGEALNEDTYTIGDEELAARGVERLPRTLDQAVDELERDELARDVLGVSCHRTFVDYKRAEWETFNTVITEWERDQYLHLW